VWRVSEQKQQYSNHLMEFMEEVHLISLLPSIYCVSKQQVSKNLLVFTTFLASISQMAADIPNLLTNYYGNVL
jgi:hypothetical protein